MMEILLSALMTYDKVRKFVSDQTMFSNRSTITSKEIDMQGIEKIEYVVHKAVKNLVTEFHCNKLVIWKEVKGIL